MLVAIMPTTAIAHKGTFKKHDHSNLFTNTHVYVAVEGTGGKIYSPANQYGTKIVKDAVWTFKAIPDPGYYFSSWHVDFDSPYNAFTKNGDSISIEIIETGTTYAVWAYFEKNHVTTLDLGVGGFFTTLLSNQYTSSGAADEDINVPPFITYPGYKFDGWDNPLRYRAEWPHINAVYEYLVTFVENDPHMSLTGNTQKFTYGQTAYAPNVLVDPGYRFDGWDTNLTGITAPTTITAKPCVKTAELTRKNLFFNPVSPGSWDTTTVYDVGSSVKLNDPLPKANYPWVFAGWIDDSTGQNIGKDPTVVVQGDCSYTATFIKEELTVSFKDQNGDSYSTPQTIIYGNNTVKPPLDDQIGTRYDANDTAWEADLLNVTEDREITVSLEYKVEFDPSGGTLISGDTTQWVAHSGNAVEPDVSPPAGQHWETPKWSSAFTNVTAPVNTAAQYDDNIYTVLFVDQNGAPYSSPQSIIHGSDAVKPTLDDPTGTRFDAKDTAWEANLLNVTENREISVALEYNIEFDPIGGTVVSGDVAQWIAHGNNAAEPNITPPTGKHWKTPKWNNAFTNVTTPVSTTAQYDDNIYTVLFVDQNGDSYAAPQNIVHGSNAVKPTLNYPTDTRFDANNTAWEADLLNVTENRIIAVALEYKVTFDPNSGTVENGDLEQWIAHGSDAIEPDITPPTGMHWETPKWSNAYTSITTPVNTTAQYNINMYTVSFFDQNGDAYSRPQLIAHAGDAAKPVLGDPVGTRYDTNNTVWQADLLNITEDREITVALEYLVKYDVSPGTSIDPNLEQWMQHGDTATAPTLIEPLGYNLNSWDNTHGPITASKTISANYVKKVYKVTIKDEADNVLASESVAYKEEVQTIPESITLPSGVRFASTAWDSAEATGITGDTTIIAHTEYLVSFVVAPGTSSDPNVSQWVSYGDDAVIPLTSPPTGKHFSKPAWSSTTTNITSPITVLAYYDINKYAVSFVDYDGSAISSVTVSHGSAATAPSSPSRTGWTFTGWDIILDPITNNVTATAQYDIKTYTVTFIDFNGKVLDEQIVDWNTGATAPVDPTRNGFTFTGWDTEFDVITQDLAVAALYEEVTVLKKEDEVPQTDIQNDAAVIEPEDTPQAKSSAIFPWWWILIGVGGAALMFLLLFFGLKRKGKTKV